MRYIELNPVRANMVVQPSEYRWSSYACNAAGKVDTLIKPHPVYSGLDAETGAKQRIYCDLFRTHLDDNQVHAIREALNQQLVLGRDDFKDKIEVMSKRQTRLKPLDRHRVEEDEACYYI